MKKTCSCLCECSNLTQNEQFDCRNFVICCGKIEICTQNASNNSCENTKKVIIKIDENTFYELIKKIKCDIKSDKFEIVGSILIGVYFYIFVQFENKILCVIQGKIDNTTLIAIDNSLKLQMCYNLYNSAKNICLDKKLAKHLKIIQVLYNPFDDLFILLIDSHNKTMLGKIEHLEGMHSVGTAIDFIFTNSCDLFIIDDTPVSICAIEKEKYKIIVFDNCKKQKKCHIICF